MAYKLTTRACGHAAEHYVCFDLARRGLTAVGNPIEGAPYDVIADYNGHMIRVQVKGTIKPTNKVNTRKRIDKVYTWSKDYYSFHVKESQLAHVDLLALVALDTQTIIYLKPSDVKKTAAYISIPEMQSGSDDALLDVLSKLDNFRRL